MRFFFEYKEGGQRRRAGAVLVVGGLFELIVGLLAAVVMVLISPWLTGMLLQGQGHTSLFLLAALMPLANIGSGLAASILAIDRAYGRTALADSVSIVGGFALLICTLPFNASVEVLLAIAVLTQFGKAVMRWVFLHRSSSATKELLLEAMRDRSCLAELRPELGRIIKFGTSNNILALLKILHGSLPMFAIGVLRTPAEVAAFYLGQRIGSRLSTFVIPIADVSFREAAEDRASGSPEKRLKTIRHGFLITLAFCMPVFIAVVPLGHWVIPLIFGQQYASSVLAVQVTVVSLILACLVNPLQSLLLVDGRTHWINVGCLLGLAIQMLLVYMTVPTHGAVGAGLSLGSFYLMSGLTMAIVAKRKPKSA